MLCSSDPAIWDRLLEDFTERLAFADPDDGRANPDAFLRRFGGRRILHGHTPIPLVTGDPAATVREPLVAPLAANQVVGELVVTDGNEVVAKVPLYPQKAVAEGGLWTQLTDSVSLWMR